MTKRNNPFCSKEGRQLISHVRKVSILFGALINASYNRMVDRRRLQEFASLPFNQRLPARKRPPRAWGAHETDGPLVHHEVAGDARLYLHVVVQGRRDHFFDNRTDKRIDGTASGRLSRFLNSRDSGYRSQGLRQPVVVKDFTLQNIAELTANKTRYTIAPAANELERYLPRTKPTATASRCLVNPSSQTPQQAGGRS